MRWSCDFHFKRFWRFCRYTCGAFKLSEDCKGPYRIVFFNALHILPTTIKNLGQISKRFDIFEHNNLGPKLLPGEILFWRCLQLCRELWGYFLILAKILIGRRHSQIGRRRLSWIGRRNSDSGCWLPFRSGRRHSNWGFRGRIKERERLHQSAGWSGHSSIKAVVCLFWCTKYASWAFTYST